MARTISFVKGKGSISHNNRVFTASNVDASRSSMNITYVNTPIEKAYEDIFGEAVSEYNDKQKRSDRKIGDYLEKIRESRNNEKIFYETVVQIGKMDDTGILDEEGKITDEALLAKEVLDEYARSFQERNPNLILFNAVLHMDEATPHLHLDYIPVAHGYKTGLKTRNSLARGLQEMGIAPAIGKNDNETMHWQKRERDFLTSLCRERGIEIEMLGVERDDYSIPEYKAAMREKEAAEAEIEILNHEKVEIEAALEESEVKIANNCNALSDQAVLLKDITAQIEEMEKKRAHKMDEVSRISKAGKKAEKEAQRIEKCATHFTPIFGGEPMVKMPRSTYDDLIRRYKQTGTIENLYKEYYDKYTAQQGLIHDLKSEISGLNNKIRQFTNFIEAKGLMEVFKEFIMPKITSITETLKRNKDKVAEQPTRRQEISPKKKNKSVER